jgi:succinate dehydrogenase / fumarate reductase membrane anchor subunit
MSTDTNTAAELTAEPTVVEVSPVSRARRRPIKGSRKELFVWYLMRVTGVALFVLALAHFSILHFIWDPAEQTADFIANERWNQIFWRGFDWLLLMTVLFHGFLGMRTVVLDYIHREGLKIATLIVLYITAILLFAIGTQVILTLPVPGAP